MKPRTTWIKFTIPLVFFYIVPRTAKDYLLLHLLLHRTSCNLCNTLPPPGWSKKKLSLCVCVIKNLNASSPDHQGRRGKMKWRGEGPPSNTARRRAAKKKKTLSCKQTTHALSPKTHFFAPVIQPHSLPSNALGAFPTMTAQLLHVKMHAHVLRRVFLAFLGPWSWPRSNLGGVRNKKIGAASKQNN